MNKRKWLFLAILTVGVFAGLLAYGDFRHIGDLLAADPAAAARALATAAGLALLNYALRYWRWHIYLRALDIDAPPSVSLPVFLAGLALSITPGKVGELLKSLWLRRLAGAPVAVSAPAVVMERLTDVVSVALLGLTGLLLLPTPFLLIAAGLLAIAAAAGWFAVSRAGAALFRLPLLRRWQEPLAQSQDGLRRLMRPRILVAAVILGFLAWAAEGLALWIIVAGIGGRIDPAVALPISAAAALAGAITALPGGLVGFEGSMVALLRQAGLTPPAASLATLLTRLATLWLAVLIGFLAWLWLTRLPPSELLPSELPPSTGVPPSSSGTGRSVSD